MRERPGGAVGAPHKVLDGTDTNDTFDVVNCSPAELLVWLSGYRSGLEHAADEHHRRREAEDRAIYQLAVRTVHGMATIPANDELVAERRRRTREAASGRGGRQ